LPCSIAGKNRRTGPLGTLVSRRYTELLTRRQTCVLVGVSHDLMLHHGELRAVLVASEDVLNAWAERLTPASGVLTLTDADLPRALQIIAERQPPLVIIEQRLAASSRGGAMLACLHGNPAMAGIQIQVLSAGKTASAGAPGSLFSAVPLTGAQFHPFERGPTRRAARVRVFADLKAEIDGAPAALVDFSLLGAQVLSPIILRPNQRVRMILLEEGEPIRATAGVAWSSFERSRNPASLVFRAGMEFTGVEAPLQAFYERLCRAQTDSEEM
jgi:hypothetical protein